MKRPHPSKHPFWRFAYRVYPKFLRVLEKIPFFKKRQPFHLGFLSKKHTTKEVLKHLEENHGFEPAILAWVDPGESLSMRKLDNEIYQYHVRIFSDGEIRAHYEFSSEGHPIGHVFESHFEPRTQEFTHFLEPFLEKKREVEAVLTSP